MLVRSLCETIKLFALNEWLCWIGCVDKFGITLVFLTSTHGYSHQRLRASYLIFKAVLILFKELYLLPGTWSLRREGSFQQTREGIIGHAKEEQILNPPHLIVNDRILSNICSSSMICINLLIVCLWGKPSQVILRTQGHETHNSFQLSFYVYLLTLPG